ncbi:NAD(P)-dependent glycerol-3-phosphate dehydrogenase [bacterium]|nr:NAD(P)-dependent glycerol-3-phosphate dehydrogenase [bacterium]
MADITVLGAGSWGTALAILLAKKDEHNVLMWEFRKDAAKKLQDERENREFLPDISFPESLQITSELNVAMEASEAILVVIPSQFVRSALTNLKGDHSEKIWIGASKGIETSSLKRMSEVAEEMIGESVHNRYVAFSGPSHAEEVARELPTSVVAACNDLEVAKKVQHWFSNPTFRVYASDDVIGVELGASLKNVVALATGMLDGLGLGDNTRGALLTRGLAEMTRLGVHLGGRPESFAGLSGMGDLITTCVSKHSRNRYVGEQLGLGRTLPDILKSMVMVAEGVETTRAVYHLAQKVGVEMPICDQVYRILFEGIAPEMAVRELMMRSLKVEHEIE